MPELSAEETSALRRACGAIRDGAECPDFFKEFLKELGVTSLPKASSKASSKPAPEQPKPADDDSDFEDDPDPDVVKPESDAPVAMGPDVAPDLSEAELDSVMELKQKAQELEASGDHQGAVDVFTQVILKAPSPLVYAKRANAFVQMRKCLAAIRDCDKALEMNPDSAKAYKTRGIAHRYLGNWEQATMDLGKGLNIDYDEDAAAIQKICAEHYNKHRVHVAKKKAARELKEREEREERARKAKEEYERQKAEAASAGARRRLAASLAAACPAWEAWAACPAWEAAAMPNIPPELLQAIMSDPELMQAMQKPKVMAALQECMSNPAAIGKYASDPEFQSIISKLQKVMPGGPMGGMGGGGPGPGFGSGMPGGFGGFPGGGASGGGFGGGQGGAPSTTWTNREHHMG